jgi:hypothetical protein
MLMKELVIDYCGCEEPRKASQIYGYLVICLEARVMLLAMIY